MKSKKILIIALLAIPAVLLTYCTKKNQVIDTGTTAPTNLYAIKGTATLQPINGSAWDGTIESVWNNAQKLTVHAAVPDLGNGTFAGFIGNATDVSIRALYDATT